MRADATILSIRVGRLLVYSRNPLTARQIADRLELDGGRRARQKRVQRAIDVLELAGYFIVADLKTTETGHTYFYSMPAGGDKFLDTRRRNEDTGLPAEPVV